ncbi:MAG: hypothetical protein H7Z42_06550, partial [Roseiflexaceae bacterium]|nr:hypothetical protein [Roseiflexaceae bacterium]
MSHSPPVVRRRWLPATPLQFAELAAALVLAALVGLHGLFFVRHAVQVLGYPFPLDYGEGPLLAQVAVLRAGGSLSQLYGPIDQPPHLVVNYPPVYLLCTLLVSSLTGGNALLAGRLVSLGSALACVVALGRLVEEQRTKNKEQRTGNLGTKNKEQRTGNLGTKNKEQR